MSGGSLTAGRAAALEDIRQALAVDSDTNRILDGVRGWSTRHLRERVTYWLTVLDEWECERIAWQFANGCDWIALDLAVLLSGRLAVPVPDFFSPAQVDHVLTTSGADLYIDADLIPRTLDSERPSLPAGTAKITFTSGTTGQPKGVCLSAEHLLATAHGVRHALAGTTVSRHLCVLPLSLLLENVIGIYANLLHGSVIIAPPLSTIGINGSSGLDVGRFTAALNVHRPESLILVPQLLLALTTAAEFGVKLPDSLRLVAVGGGKVPLELIARAKRFGIPVHEGYGLTECGSVVALNTPDATRPGSVGKPLPHLDIRIDDNEIVVSGSAMLGYLGGPKMEEEIRTGDLGHIDDDGYLYVDGRRKHGFITAFGRNVSPEWPESELQAEFLIAHALVFGEGLPGNTALIVPRLDAPDEVLDTAIARANQRLPDYARIARWHRVGPAAFSATGCLTSNGRSRRDHAAHVFADALHAMANDLRNQIDVELRTTSR